MAHAEEVGQLRDAAGATVQPKGLTWAGVRPVEVAFNYHRRF